MTKVVTSENSEKTIDTFYYKLTFFKKKDLFSPIPKKEGLFLALVTDVLLGS